MKKLQLIASALKTSHSCADNLIRIPLDLHATDARAAVEMLARYGWASYLDYNKLLDYRSPAKFEDEASAARVTAHAAAAMTFIDR